MIIVFISIWYVKLVKPTSILTVVFFTAKIDYYKPVLFFSSRLTQLSEFFLSHIASHMIIENVVKILQVLRKQTNEIRILSDCLAGEFEIVLLCLPLT